MYIINHLNKYHDKRKGSQKTHKKILFDCIHLAAELPNTFLGNHIKGQLIRSSTSVAANYRAANLAQSTAAFVSKTSIVIEEADESQFWLELADDLELLKSAARDELENEASELTAIFVSSRKKLQNRKFT